MTTVTLPRCLVAPVSADGTFDIYLDDSLVASGFTTEREAILELEQIRFHVLFGEALPLPGRIVTTEALALGHAVFQLLFSTPEVCERADRALRDILARDPPPYTILPDGTLHVLASSARRGPSSYTIATTPAAGISFTSTDAALPDSYRVRESCTCPDFRTRSDAHGSLCKHIAARHILFLAQQGVGALLHLRDALATSAADLAPAETLPSLDDTAFISLPAQALAAACYVPFLAGSPVEVRSSDGLITLSAGQFTVSIPGLDSHGTGVLTLDTEAFASLWRQLSPAVKNGLATATLTVFLAPPTLCISAPNGFAIEANT